MRTTKVVLDSARVPSASLIREPVPHVNVGLTELLRARPDQITELHRYGYGRYAADVTVEPVMPRRDEPIPYELVSLAVRPPGANEWRDVPLPMPGNPFLYCIDLARAEIGHAELRYRASLVRRDPVYGQGVLELQDVVQFRPEPTKRILSVFPIPDWMMGPLPV